LYFGSWLDYRRTEAQHYEPMNFLSKISIK
jgi:hypothetical protein